MLNEITTTAPTMAAAPTPVLSTATAYFVLTEFFTRHRARRGVRPWTADSDRATVALYRIPVWLRRGMMPHEQIQFRAGSKIITRPAPSSPWDAWANEGHGDAPKHLLIFDESDVIARPPVEYPPSDTNDMGFHSQPIGRRSPCSIQ